MSDSVTAAEMRARLLAGLDRPTPISEDWVVVLGAPGNRQLLSLIGTRHPSSIGELADLAARAQPNISRSLSALAAAGLIEVRSNGRRSVPSLTALGRAKAEELHLLETGFENAEREGDDALFSVDFDPVEMVEFASPADTDELNGRIGHSVYRPRAREAETAFWRGNLVLLSMRLVSDWWRILYRRDAPYRLMDLEAGRDGERVGVSVRSLGHNVDLFVRWESDDRLERAPESAKLTIARLEQSLLEQWLKPVCERLRASGRVDCPLQSNVVRLLDSMSDPDERAFCRTGGALNLSPYGLDESRAAAVRNLVAAISDEDARLDFASAVLSEKLAEGNHWIEREVEDHRESNLLSGLTEMRRACAAPPDRLARPWRRGRDLARVIRGRLGLEIDRSLGGLGGIAIRFGAERFGLSRNAPGGVRGFQSLTDTDPVIVVEDEGCVASAFVLARAIGDDLAFGSSNACVADLYTDRQAVGRAFAAEFLAPGAGVTAMIDEGAPLFRVQDHYGVSPEVVRRQYENFER